MPTNYVQFVPLLLIFAAFYFFMLRPQQKRQKERTSMLGALKKGDKVITIGGLHGSVVDLNDNTVTLKVSDNNRLVYQRSAINEIIKEETVSEEK